jgi:DNA polymerase-1
VLRRGPRHIRPAGEQAGRLLFGESAVKFPLDVSVVRCYADAA